MSKAASNASAYTAILNTVSGQALGAIAATRPQLNRIFVGSMMNCPTFASQDTKLAETDCAWARVVGSWIDRSATDGAGFSAASQTYQLGGQREVSDGWFVGGSLAYESGSFHSDDYVSHISGDTVTAGAFVKRQIGHWLLATSLSGGLSRYESRRTIQVGPDQTTAVGNPDASYVSGHAQITYNASFGNFYLRPYADFDITRVSVDRYAESGSPYALSVGSDSEYSYLVSPTLELGGRVSLGTGSYLRPYAQVGAVYHSSNTWTSTSQLVAASDAVSGFHSTTQLPDLMAKLGGGVDLLTASGLEFKLQYNAELAGVYRAQTAMARLAWHF